jgi:hypothetical protein
MVLPKELRLPRFVITCTLTFAPLPKTSERWAIGHEIYPEVVSNVQHIYPGVTLGELVTFGPYWERVLFTVEIDQNRIDLGDEILDFAMQAFRERFLSWCSRLQIESFDWSEPILLEQEGSE